MIAIISCSRLSRILGESYYAKTCSSLNIFNTFMTVVVAHSYKKSFWEHTSPTDYANKDRGGFNFLEILTNCKAFKEFKKIYFCEL